jgi:hypothetical protein
MSVGLLAVSDISTCETDLTALGLEDFWLIVTIKEWRWDGNPGTLNLRLGGL